jgi:pimeloyl-ACP methyl ester carboxylesterase
LIIHDEEDEDIDISEAHTIHQAWPGSELLITKGLGHVRITRSAEVAERVRDFLLS